MPPKRATFSRIEPPPRQTRLSSRRSLPLTHRRDSPPTRQKRQSTLTQLDYVRSDDTIPNSTDEEEDSEYEETQPTKKLRLSGAKKGKGHDRGQSTLTQKWDWKAMAAARDIEDSDDDPMGLIDEGHEQKKIGPQRPSSNGHTQTQSELLLSAHLDSDSEADSSTQQPKRVAFAPSSDFDKDSTRPTTADSTPNPKTPRRPRRLEIPSSETPSSLKLSRHSPKQHTIYERSPLKDRSSNLPSLKRSRSPSAEKKPDDNGKTQALPSDETNDNRIQIHPWTATLAMTPKKDSVSGKRQLQRVSTIQESEASDMEIDLSPIQGKPEEVSASPSHQPVQRKRRSLQRVTTIQDSEENSSDLIEPETVQPSEPATGISQEIESAPTPNRCDTVQDGTEHNMDSKGPLPDPPEIDLSPKRASQSTPPDLEDVQVAMDTEPPQAMEPINAGNDSIMQHAGITEHVKADLDLDERDDETDDDLNPHVCTEDLNEDDDDEEDEDYMDDESYPQTYDPVSAALERDAARYGRDTQYESDVEDADDEDSVVAASDRGLEVNEPAQEVEYVPSSQPGESRIQSSQELVALPAGESMARKQTLSAEVDDSGYSSQQGTAKPNRYLPFVMNDSGPRPSQISTVADDTQSQRSRPNSAHGWTQKPAPAWPETLSSSPFPMPPGFAMRSQRRAGETQSSGLVDFSLPPPPQLFLSSSRVEGEGS